MQIPFQITFHRMEPSDALRFVIENKILKLEKFSDRITSVRVTVSLSGGRHERGNLFSVRVEMTLPGQILVVNREPKAHQSHQDPYVATRDAFRAARRQLEDYVRIHYRKKKRHRVTSLYGKVIRILLDRDGGFLKTPDGREIYFNRRSVLSPGFDALRPGDEVRFTEEQGEEGPQASSLSLS